MSAIKLSTPSSGSISLSPADTASNLVITVPAVTGTMNLVGPAFSAYSSTATSLPNATFTKITFDTEEFDTNNNFASSRFTPTVAGYYQVNCNIGISSGTYKNELALYKNGSPYKYGMYPNSVTSDTAFTSLSSLVYLNGSTDYVEIYCYQTSGGSLNTLTSSASNWFNGSLVRGA